jgi:hypothetical protein
MRLGRFGKILHFDKTSIGIGDIKRFTIIELKYIGGIIINKFNTTNQDRFHSHAFFAFSWMIRGWYNEDIIKDNKIISKKITKSRIIPKNHIHKIKDSSKDAISVTFEGPWGNTWSEFYDDGRVKVYSWGRRVLFDSKYFNKLS